MTWNFQNVFNTAFCWVFCCFLAVHFAHMKTPSQNREIANFKPVASPVYDSSFKL